MSCRKGFGSPCCCMGDSDPGLDRSLTYISLLVSRRLVHEALRRVSSSVLSESQGRGGGAGGHQPAPSRT